MPRKPLTEEQKKRKERIAKSKGEKIFSTAKIIKALRKCKGMKTLAAKEVGCSYQTIYNRALREKEIQDVCEEEDEKLLDLAELKFHEMIQEKNSRCVIYCLQTKGEKRGYGSRKIHTIEGGKSPIKLSGKGLIDVESLNLTIEQKREILKAFEQQEAE